MSGRQNKSPHLNAPPRSPLRSHLAWHGRQWRVQVAVPAKLRPIIGTAVLFHPLHTDSLALANRDKHKHIHALKQRLAAAEIELRRRSKGTIVDPLVAEGSRLAGQVTKRRPMSVIPRRSASPTPPRATPTRSL